MGYFSYWISICLYESILTQWNLKKCIARNNNNNISEGLSIRYFKYFELYSNNNISAVRLRLYICIYVYIYISIHMYTCLYTFALYIFHCCGSILWDSNHWLVSHITDAFRKKSCIIIIVIIRSSKRQSKPSQKIGVHQAKL